MLLRNESRVRHSIDIKLVFDDNRVRKLEINEGDYVQVSYRKNGCIKCGVGIIRDIKAYIHSKKWPFCKRESAVITLDMSEDFISCIDKIDMFDIIDIRKIEYDNTTDDNPNPDFDVKFNNNIVGCPITSKGVVIHD